MESRLTKSGRSDSKSKLDSPRTLVSSLKKGSSGMTRSPSSGTFTETSVKALDGFTAFTCETQLDFPRYYDNWLTCKQVVPNYSKKEQEKQYSRRIEIVKKVLQKDESDDDDDTDIKSSQEKDIASTQLKTGAGKLDPNNNNSQTAVNGYVSQFQNEKPETIQKPTCKYGAACYRANQKHIEEFHHPQQDQIKKNIPSNVTQQPQQQVQVNKAAPMLVKPSIAPPSGTSPPKQQLLFLTKGSTPPPIVTKDTTVTNSNQSGSNPTTPSSTAVVATKPLSIIDMGYVEQSSTASPTPSTTPTSTAITKVEPKPAVPMKIVQQHQQQSQDNDNNKLVSKAESYYTDPNITTVTTVTTTTAITTSNKKVDTDDDKNQNPQTLNLFKKRYHVQGYGYSTNRKTSSDKGSKDEDKSTTTTTTSTTTTMTTGRKPAPSVSLPLLLQKFSSDQLRRILEEVAYEKEIDEYLLSKLTKLSPVPEGIIGDESIFQWNTKFQSCIEMIRKLSPNTRQEDRIKVYEELAHHSQDFIYTATTYGKIIISEVYLPPEQKTIKPIFMEGRGIAGGEKYLQRGIYFKFAVDAHELYHEEESVSKVLGHELKSLNQLFGLWIKDIYFPMMIILDYRGFRLIAMSTLPINENTIVYGSSDAGSSIHTDNQFINEKMKFICQRLNLKEHKVGPVHMNKVISTPVDLEAHYGFDGRFYLLDFSRMFPPATPDGTQSSYLFKLLRPEFVRRFHKPLCSDSFSNFIKNHSPEFHNEEVVEATTTLKSKIIPEYAKTLTDIPQKLRAHYPFKQALNSAGINMRYLGILRSHLPEDEKYWRFIILLEMVTRALKQQIRHELRELMRKLKHQGEEPYKQKVIDYLNLIFGDIPLSDAYWNKEIKSMVINKFESAFSDEELLDVYPFKKKFTEAVPGLSDGKCLLFSKLSQVCGLQWQHETFRAFTENPGVFGFACPLDEADLEFKACVKSMNIAEHSEAFVIKLKASKRTGEESTRLYKLAIEKFTTALELIPGNKVTLRNLADCLMCIHEFEQAEYYYQEAIRSGPMDTNTLFKYACFLECWGKYDLAEENYLKSLECYPLHSNCLTVYADFLTTCRKNYDEAEIFYKCAVEADKRNSFALNNYGCFLAFVRQDYNKAEKKLRKAISVDPNHPIHLRNYAVFVDTFRKNPEEAEKFFKKGQEIGREKLMRSFSLSPELTKLMTKSQKRNVRRKKKNKEKTNRELDYLSGSSEEDDATLLETQSEISSNHSEASSDFDSNKKKERKKERKNKKHHRRKKSENLDFLEEM